MDKLKFQVSYRTLGEMMNLPETAMVVSVKDYPFDVAEITVAVEGKFKIPAGYDLIVEKMENMGDALANPQKYLQKCLPVSRRVAEEKSGGPRGEDPGPQ